VRELPDARGARAALVLRDQRAAVVGHVAHGRYHLRESLMRHAAGIDAPACRKRGIPLRQTGHYENADSQRFGVAVPGRSAGRRPRCGPGGLDLDHVGQGAGPHRPGGRGAVAAHGLGQELGMWTMPPGAGCP
jgi:hypothetical protein